MKVKQKIIETRAGFRCRVCGRRFSTEEAAFVHQSYDCSRDVRTMVEDCDGKGHKRRGLRAGLVGRQAG
jgi:transposase-like protein